jgi:methionyl-tRNA synthetase
VRSFPDTLDLHAITTAARSAVSELAQYIAREQPWAKAKEEGGLPRVRQVLAWSLETLRLVGLAVQPIMPEKVAALRELLGEPAGIDFEREAAWGLLPAGREVGSTKGLFPRIEENSLPAAPDAAS